MSEVKLNQFYNTTAIETSSELFYVIELSKYLSKTGDILSLEGVKLASHLERSRFWNYLKVACYNKWLTGLNMSPMWLNLDSVLSTMARNTSKLRNVLVSETDNVDILVPSDMDKRRDLLYDITTPVVLPVKFNTISNDRWEWSFQEQGRLSSFYFDPMSQNIVSIVAYIAVRKFKTGVPRTFHLDLSDIKFQQSLGVVDMDVIADMTDAFTGWLTYDLDDEITHKANRGYESWYYLGAEKGMLVSHGADGYTADEKRNRFIALGFKVGDVVGLYKRKTKQQSNAMKSIAEFNYAIVRKISKASIQLEVLFTLETPYQKKAKYESLNMQIKSLYTSVPDFNKFNSSIKSFSWYDIGVEYYMLDELTFIAPLYHVGGDYNCLPIAMSEKDSWLLPQEQAIYWLLKVYGIDFNEEHYKAEHFGDNVPFYDSFMATT